MTKQSDPTTNNYKKAKVLALNDHVEEDVTLLIEGTVINCFISYSPYQIMIGNTYDVELTINLADDYHIERAQPRNTLAEWAGCGYSYFLYGELCNDSLHTFTTLNDEDLHYDHPECNDHFIKLKVERIDVTFH